MVTMMDELFDRMYQDNRGELNAGVNRAFGQLGHAIDNAFKVLERIEYNSPWTQKSPRRRVTARAH
jgi:hypothetical protein